MQPPLFSDANHDVIDFEICAFRKITEIWFRERIFFVQIKKNHLLHIKGYFMAKFHKFHKFHMKTPVLLSLFN